MQTIIGNIYPHLITPQPDDDSFLDIVVEVVAVVMGVCTGQLYLAGIGALMSAATAAVVDLAGQGLLVGLGVQHKIQLDQVLDASLQAGFFVAFEGEGSGLQMAILESGQAEVSRQMVELAAGTRDSLDMASIATAMATAGVDQPLTNAPGQGQCLCI